MHEGRERGRAELQPHGRNLSAGSIPAKQAKPGGKRERKIRGRSGVEELVDSSGS